MVCVSKPRKMIARGISKRENAINYVKTQVCVDIYTIISHEIELQKVLLHSVSLFGFIHQFE